MLKILQKNSRLHPTTI